MEKKVPNWIRLILGLFAFAFLVIGIFLFFDPYFYFGTGGYNIGGHYAIQILSSVLVVFGSFLAFSIVKNNLTTTYSYCTILLCMVLVFPFISTMNMGAFDRLYENTGLTVINFAFLILIVAVFPIALCYFKLRTLNKEQ